MVAGPGYLIRVKWYSATVLATKAMYSQDWKLASDDADHVGTLSPMSNHWSFCSLISSLYIVYYLINAKMPQKNNNDNKRLMLLCMWS